MLPTFEQWLKGKIITESMSRHCAIYKLNTGQWWMELADDEYGEQWDSRVYGPFSSQEKAEDELDQYSNPGSLYIDDSGERPNPTKSPNGEKIRQPEIRRKQRYSW